MEKSQVLQRFGNVHSTIHNDPHRIIQLIVRTGTKMLLARGVARVDQHDDVVKSIEEEDGLILTGYDAQGVVRERIYVHAEDRVGVKYARSIVEANEGCNAIIVSIEGPTPFTRRECDSVQFMNARDLCVNVVDHTLVPRHERIDASELPTGVSPESLPRLFDTDRVAQYYNWKVGTVVRITRNFGGHEPIPYYRVVVPGS